MSGKFRVANAALKDARRRDAQRFSASLETLERLSRERRAAADARAAASVISAAPDVPASSDDAPFPQYDPAAEASFDVASDFSDFDAPAPVKIGMSLEQALAHVPADVISFVRERFRAEFSVLRRPGKVFSFRENAAEEDGVSGTDDAEVAEDVSDDA